MVVCRDFLLCRDEEEVIMVVCRVERFFAGVWTSGDAGRD